MGGLLALFIIIGCAFLLGMYLNQIRIIKQNNRIIDLLEGFETTLQRQNKE